MSPLPRLAAVALAASVLAGCNPSVIRADFGIYPPAIKGTLDFRDHVALPPDTMIVMTLLDTTPVIMSTPIVAETVIRGDGLVPPIPFELPFDRSRIIREHLYGVRAAVRSGPRVLFETAGSYPVLTRGNPNQVELQLVRVAADVSIAVPALVGTAWRLEDLAGAGVIDGAEATLEFPEAGRVAGQATCNRYFGYFETAGPSLTIARLGATKKLCPPALMDQETRFLRALEGAERFAIEGRTLLVNAKGFDKPLRFVRKGA